MKNHIVLVIAVLAAHTALGASGARNGADNPSADHGAAWFVGDRAIKYCLEAAGDFGATDAELAAEIEFSFVKWRQYLGERQQAVNADPTRGAGPQLVFNSRRLAACDGSQDLAFFFAVQNELVGKYLPFFDRPTAFAQRTSYDTSTMWGSGFIWVAPSRYVEPDYREDGWNGFPDWQVPASRKAVLLHELGHVLGIGHVDGTIMDERFNLRMKVQLAGAGSIFSDQNDGILRIEMSRFLAPPWPRRPAYTDEWPAADNRDVRALERILGRMIKGDLTMRLTLEADATYRFTVKDAVREDTLTIAYRLIGLDRTETSFIRTWTTRDGDGQTRDHKSGVLANKLQSLGTLKGVDGQSYPVLIKDDGGVTIELISDPLSKTYLFQGQAAKDLLAGQ